MEATSPTKINKAAAIHGVAKRSFTLEGTLGNTSEGGRKMLDYGTDYGPRGKVYGFLISFLSSLALRGLPLILANTLEGSFLQLYMFPFWLGIDLALISVFAIYGWFGVGVAILIDAHLRPALFVDPLFFVLSELTVVSAVIVSHSLQWHDRIRSKPVSLFAATALPFPFAPILFAIFLRLLEVTLAFSTWISFIVVWTQSFVALCLTSPLSLSILSRRESHPDSWAPDWLMLLMTGTGPDFGRQVSENNFERPLRQSSQVRGGPPSANRRVYRLWWDFENIALSPREIKAFVRQIPGRTIPGMAFADWNRYSPSAHDTLYNFRVTPVSVPDNRENAADKVMQSKMGQIRLEEGITEIVVTGDGDFLPVVRSWVENGVSVWVVTGDSCYSNDLAMTASYHSEISSFPGTTSSGQGHFSQGYEMPNVSILCQQCDSENDVSCTRCVSCGARL